MTDNNKIIKQLSRGVFTTTDATATKVPIANNIADMIPTTITDQEEAVVRVVCKVMAQNILFADIAYYFEVHALFEYNQFELNKFYIVGTPTTTTHSEPTSSVCTCTIDNTNDLMNLAIAGEAGETFNWTYEADLTIEVVDKFLDDLTFQMLNDLSGVDNLDASLTINGQTVTPTFRYKGGDADATDWNYWTYGADLPRVSVATQPTYNNGSPCLGTNDDSVLFNESDYYQAALATTGDITTEDFVIEGLIKARNGGTANNQLIIDKRDTVGWEIYMANNGQTVFLIDDVSGSIFSTVTFVPGTWNHFIWFVNRDEASSNGGNVYVNGILADSDDFSSRSGTLTSAAKLSIGASAAGTVHFDSNIAYLAMWKYADWHQAGASGPAEWATIAAERFAKLTGFYPQHAEGTYMPTVSQRDDAAYLDKIESDSSRKLYRVGPDWLRQCHRNDGTNDIYGYLPEVQSTNQIPYSEDIDNPAWTPTQVTFHATKIDAPNGEQTAIGMIASIVAGTHVIGDVMTSSAGTDCVSCWAKKGNEDWIRLYYGTVAASCYFDLNNGVLGTASNATGYIEDWGNDWFRCIMTFTGDSASHTFSVFSAEANNDVNFSGDGTNVTTYVWGIQYEQGMDYASSYIPTAGASDTRVKDELYYLGSDGNVTNNTQGTIVLNVLLPAHTNTTNKRSLTLSDGTDTNNRLGTYVGTTDKASYYSTSDEGNDGSTTTLNNVSDGEVHVHRATWETDNAVMYEDGVPDATPDVDCTAPNDLDRINIGMTWGLAQQFNGLIENIRIYDVPTSRG